MRGPESYYEPIYSTVPSIPFYWLMRTYNRRFAAMARNRRRRNVRGKTNANRRFLVPGFSFALPTQLLIVRALASWGMLELVEGWRTWFRKEESRLGVGLGLRLGTEPASSPNRNPNPNLNPSIPNPAQPVQ
jgi:hypothetical protein